MHLNRFRLGLRSRPRWGSLQRSPYPLAVFKGPTSKGRRGRGREKENGRGGEGKREGRESGRARGRGGGGTGGENDLTHPLSQIPGYATAKACVLELVLELCCTCRLLRFVNDCNKEHYMVSLYHANGSNETKQES